MSADHRRTTPLAILPGTRRGPAGALRSSAVAGRVLVDRARLRAEVRHSRRLSRVLHLVENEHARPDLCLTLAADACGTEKNHLNHLLRSATGWTFHQLLTRYRILRAAQIIRSSNRSLLCVALEAGFGSLSSLERNFSRHVGLTPRDYRKRCRPIARRRPPRRRAS